jgi:glycerate 2-kinase
MRILIAPDKFKGTLTSIEASAAMAAGAQQAARQAGVAVEIDECPVADGGEGFLDAVIIATGAETRRASVTGPAGETAAARWAIEPTPSRRERLLAGVEDAMRMVSPIPQLRGLEARSGFIESAAACGLTMVPEARRDPSRCTTRGVGELVREASRAGAERIVIGLGGSATVDGGIGMAAALGARFVRADGTMIEPIGANLHEIARVVPIDDDAMRLRTSVVACCDVDNPLTGPRGAAMVYGPQKGATPEQARRLDEGLAHLVRVCRACGVACEPDAPGAGAAGGLGFGLATFLGATLVPGADHVLGLLGFARRAALADLVITGEGRLDAQTAHGKACAAVARQAGTAKRAVIAVVGDTEGTPDEVRARLAAGGAAFDGVWSLTDLAHSPEHAIAHAAGVLEECTRRAVSAWIESRTAPGRSR